MPASPQKPKKGFLASVEDAVINSPLIDKAMAASKWYEESKRNRTPEEQKEIDDTRRIALMAAIQKGIDKVTSAGDIVAKNTSTLVQPMTGMDTGDLVRATDYAKRYTDLGSELRKISPSTGKLGKALKGSPVLAAAGAAIDTARMINPETRQETIDQTYDDAQNASGVERAFKGFFSPIETATGVGAMLMDLGKSTAEAKKAERNAPSDEQLLKAYLQAKERKRLQEMRRADKVAPEEMRDRPYVGEQFT